MKHMFIINPAAGKGKRSLKLIPEIKAYFAEYPDDYEIYITKAKRDATDYVRRRAMQGEAFRFYACGGDGTLMEVLNGAYGYENAEIACIPCGSANDYVRIYGGKAAFTPIAAQVNGTAHEVDVIDCNGYISFNICTMGMDADVADKMIWFKHYPLVTGPMAYQLAIVYVFLHHFGRRLHITMETKDGIVVKTGDFLFTLAANGQYYGGGFRGAPQAVVDDGLLDFICIDTIRRLAVPSFLKRYKAGKHLDMPIIHTYRGYRMHVDSDSPITMCVDGECFTENEVNFEIHPKAVKFVLPDGVKMT